MGKDRSLEGGGFHRHGRARSKEDIAAERERIDLVHEELSQALVERHKDADEWANKKFGEREMHAILRQTGYADDPLAAEMFTRAVEHVRHHMGLLAEFRSPVAMEHFRPGMSEPLCYNINRSTERKIREGIAGAEGCDFTTDEDMRVIMRTADVGVLTFHDEDKPAEEFKSDNQDSPKMPWDQG